MLNFDRGVAGVASSGIPGVGFTTPAINSTFANPISYNTNGCCGPSPSSGIYPQNNSICGPSIPGQGCCGPSTVGMAGQFQSGYNTGGFNQPGGVNGCCTPTLSPNIMAGSNNGLYGPIGNTGTFCGPSGACDCCGPRIDSAYLLNTRVRGGGFATRQTTIVQQIPSTTIVNPISNSVYPVMTPMITQTATINPGIVQTGSLYSNQVILNPSEKLSPETQVVYQNIQSRLPLYNLNIGYESPQYLSEKQGIYVGQWLNGSMNGYGKIFFDNGGYFEGQFVNGIANTPNGCFIYPDGSYYIGGVSNNNANGQGVYTYKNNTLVYRGNFVNDQPQGRGVEEYADGSRYEGDFRFGRKEGRGIFSWKDGTVYQGQFEGGFMQGLGTHRLSNGEVYEGEFRRNKRHGIGRHTTSIGSYYGGYRNDTKQGEGTFNWNDGRIFRGSFRDGRPDGPGSITQANGNVVSGIWVNGTLDPLSVGGGSASNIGSMGAIGGTSIINRGGSLLNQAQSTTITTVQTTQFQTPFGTRSNVGIPSQIVNTNLVAPSIQGNAFGSRVISPSIGVTSGIRPSSIVGANFSPVGMNQFATSAVTINNHIGLNPSLNPYSRMGLLRPVSPVIGNVMGLPRPVSPVIGNIGIAPFTNVAMGRPSTVGIPAFASSRLAVGSRVATGFQPNNFSLSTINNFGNGFPPAGNMIGGLNMPGYINNNPGVPQAFGQGVGQINMIPGGAIGGTRLI